MSYINKEIICKISLVNYVYCFTMILVAILFGSLSCKVEA